MSKPLVQTFRVCAACQKSRPVELKKLHHGWLCTRCGRAAIFRPATNRKEAFYERRQKATY